MIRDARYVEPSSIEDSRAKLLVYLTKHLDGGVDRPEGDVSVILLQKAKTGELEVADLPFCIGESVEKLTSDLLEAAENDALNWPGKTRYACRVERVASACTFVLEVPKIQEDEDNDLSDLEELPNKRGLIGQQMRHNEKTLDLALKAATRSQERDERRIRELEARESALMKQVWEANQMLEQVRSLAFMRDMEVKKFEAEQGRKDQVAGGLMMAVKMIGTSYMQKQGMLPPGGMNEGTPSPFESLGIDLFASLEKDGDRLQKIVGAIGDMLTPTEIGAFLQMRQMTIERMAREQGGQPAGGDEPPEEPNGPAPHMNGTTGATGLAYQPWTPGH